MTARALIAAAALVAGILVAVAGRQASPPAPAAGPLRPAFALADLQGSVHHAAEWDGQAVLLNFWASWCGPCREEVPLLIEAQRRDGPAGLQVVGIAIDDAAAAAGFARDAGINYPVLIGDEGGIALATALGNASGGLPFTVAIGRDRRVAAVHQGRLDRATLNALIERVR